MSIKTPYTVGMVFRSETHPWFDAFVLYAQYLNDGRTSIVLGFANGKSLLEYLVKTYGDEWKKHRKLSLVDGELLEVQKVIDMYNLKFTGMSYDDDILKEFFKKSAICEIIENGNYYGNIK